MTVPFHPQKIPSFFVPQKSQSVTIMYPQRQHDYMQMRLRDRIAFNAVGATALTGMVAGPILVEKAAGYAAQKTGEGIAYIGNKAYQSMSEFGNTQLRGTTVTPKVDVPVTSTPTTESRTMPIAPYEQAKKKLKDNVTPVQPDKRKAEPNATPLKRPRFVHEGDFFVRPGKTFRVLGKNKHKRRKRRVFRRRV